MEKAQHIAVKTHQGKHADIVVIENSAGSFSVLMSGAAFPLGTTFHTAEEAAKAAVQAIGNLVKPDVIAGLYSAPVEEFVSNAQLKQLIVMHEAVSLTHPIDVAIENIPAGGMKVCVRYGECFESIIEWDKPCEQLLVISSHCNMGGESGVRLFDLSGVGSGWGYAGYDRETLTWWRYKAEASPGASREHCMQILRILDPAS